MIERETVSESESIQRALRIVSIPQGEVPNAIREMIHRREFYRTVSGLNALLRKPQHAPLARDVLGKCGLWHSA